MTGWNHRKPEGCLEADMGGRTWRITQTLQGWSITSRGDGETGFRSEGVESRLELAKGQAEWMASKVWAS